MNSQPEDTCSYGLAKWRVKANETKLGHVDFTMKNTTYPPILYSNEPISRYDKVKYLGLNTDGRLIWKHHLR